MTNPQQPELRRNARNSAVQDSKGPSPRVRPPSGARSRGDAGRAVPEGQVSPYGPVDGPVADDASGDRD
ncbi:hypothetical protein [Micromonospora sp. SH-82]|uniref:hypothetical protein n=1 Tax=Micromonospora sp. SH-82 TaxID=3132938 RepID=UPI003EB82259